MIKIGEAIPSIPLKVLTPEGVKEVHLKNQLKGKRVVLFGVPGAFTPTCSKIHLPSFIKLADDIKAKGVDEIICIAVNDPFVLDVWEKVTHAEGKITLLSDGNGEFTKAMGLTLDAQAHGLGIRSQRYVSLIEDGILKYIEVESQPTDCTVTCAEEILKHL